eukprot:1415684-Ditylum_brightwellii.AAC.1
MFGGNAELHTTDDCNKKNLFTSLFDGYKKKQMDKAKKENFVPWQKLSRRPPLRAKKLVKGRFTT